MKGTIRFILGLTLVLGSVGGIEHQPTANIWLQLAVAGVGLALMFWATKAFQEVDN